MNVLFFMVFLLACGNLPTVPIEPPPDVCEITDFSTGSLDSEGQWVDGEYLYQANVSPNVNAAFDSGVVAYRNKNVYLQWLMPLNGHDLEFYFDLRSIDIKAISIDSLVFVGDSRDTLRFSSPSAVDTTLVIPNSLFIGTTFIEVYGSAAGLSFDNVVNCNRR